MAFLACLITALLFRNKVSALEDGIYEVISQTSVFFHLYDISLLEESDNEFAAYAAYFIPALQGIQIVTVVDKLVEHEGAVNKILFWVGTLFLELFLGFTVETYQESNLAALFLGTGAVVMIYGLICTLRVTHNPWLFLPVFMAQSIFLNHVSRYLWAYFIGLFAEQMTFALILTIPSKLHLKIIFYILMFILTPFMTWINNWVVDKCLGLFFSEIYDKEDICILDMIGLGIAALFLIIWIVNITVLS